MTRVQLLAELIKRFSDGKAKAFAEKIHSSESMVSQWKNGNRMIGDASCRKIELALKLPAGWFDLKNPIGVLTGVAVEPAATEVAPDPQTREVLRLMAETDEQGRLLALGAVRYALSQHRPAKANSAA